MTQPNYEKHSQHYLFNISYWFMTQKKCTSQTGTWKQKLVWTARLDFNILLLSQVKGFCRDLDVTTVEFNLVVVTSSSAQSSHHGDVFLIPLCWIGFPIQSEWYCFFLFVFFLTYTFHLQNLTTHILTFTNKQSNIC